MPKAVKKFVHAVDAINTVVGKISYFNGLEALVEELEREHG